jgi:hypoxanthine phosphoribosyltransferase
MRDPVPFHLDAARIDRIVRELAAQIRCDYPRGGLCVVAVLRGGMMLAVDLVRALYPLDVRLDVFPGTTLDVSGKPVLVVDDIIDSGRTARELVAWAQERGASEVALCALLRRHSTPEPPVRAYTDVTIDSDEFVKGYGMDDGDGDAGRELPFVCGTGRRSARAPS